IDLDVSSVTSSAKIAGYSTDDKAITITFERGVEPGNETTVTITYEAEPKQGLYFRTPEMGYKAGDTHLWTQGETHKGPHWYPNYDYPNERSTSEVICRVPADMIVLSNGRCVGEVIDPETGLKVVQWLQDKPHVNYLIALVAGKFEKVESKYKDIPLAFYTPPSQIEQAQNSFEDTADMMAFFENDIGIPYPWAQYNQVAVDDFISGAMENTTLTVLNDFFLFTDATENVFTSQNVVAHELVHQWFGDYVTCKDWSHIWLNEGFATYYAHLYEGHKHGRDSILYALYRDAADILEDRPIYKPIFYRSYESAWEQFEYHRIYQKGSWIVHMLRSQLGDKLYRRCIKTYLTRQALSSVVTEDLNSVIEQLSGRTFDRFFDQWIYHARHPDLTIGYSWSEKDKLAKVSVEQTHTVDDNVMLFHFPTKVRFVVDGKNIDHDIIIDKKQHDFYFPLEKEPTIVRFDPEYSILANIKFEKPAAMLYAQLDNESDVVGRLLATQALKEKKDKKTVAQLKESLNNDSCYGVRIEAAHALGEIHTDEAFEALIGSLAQDDARVRLETVLTIPNFYRPETFEQIKQVLADEENPAIVVGAISSLDCYHHEDTRELLVKYLESKSYRNMLASATFETIQVLDEPYFIGPLQSALEKRKDEFISWLYAEGLIALAHITRNEDDKTDVFNFLTDYVNDDKENIKAGAIVALGELGDPKAIPIVQTLAGDDPDDRIQRTAKEALKQLHEKTELVPKEIIKLRETVDEIKKDYKNLKDELEDIKKRLDASDQREESDDGEPNVPNEGDKTETEADT
ncbi:MAG: M1 family aminopeptidase, partial [Planctomycetota bacterium]